MSIRRSPVSSGSCSTSSYPCAGRSESRSRSAGSPKRSTRARTAHSPGPTRRRARAPRNPCRLIASLHVKHTCGEKIAVNVRPRLGYSRAVRVTGNTVTRSCAVCERTLLTGERAVRFSPDGDGEFVDVCPLCQEIALDHGWVKEGSPTTPTMPFSRRRRRGLGALFERPPAVEPIVSEPILRRLSEPELAVVEAADLFNSSPFRRTVGGIAKSLGEPRASILQ